MRYISMKRGSLASDENLVLVLGEGLPLDPVVLI